jgi:hypothetical protein
MNRTLILNKPFRFSIILNDVLNFSQKAILNFFIALLLVILLRIFYQTYFYNEQFT